MPTLSALHGNNLAGQSIYNDKAASVNFSIFSVAWYKENSATNDGVKKLKHFYMLAFGEVAGHY